MEDAPGGPSQLIEAREADPAEALGVDDGAILEAELARNVLHDAEHARADMTMRRVRALTLDQICCDVTHETRSPCPMTMSLPLASPEGRLTLSRAMSETIVSVSSLSRDTCDVVTRLSLSRSTYDERARVACRLSCPCARMKWNSPAPAT